MKPKKWVWAFALLPLVCVPLIAQEPKAEDSGAQGQDAAPAPPAASAPAEEQPEAASQGEPQPPEERVSADNNLSFPVDI